MFFKRLTIKHNGFNMFTDFAYGTASNFTVPTDSLSGVDTGAAVADCDKRNPRWWCCTDYRHQSDSINQRMQLFLVFYIAIFPVLRDCPPWLTVGATCQLHF